MSEATITLDPVSQDAPRSVLVPLDGSEQARSAIPYAATLSAPDGVIVLLTVVPEADAIASESATDPHQQMLAAAAAASRGAGRTVETRVMAGDPAAHIVEAAANGGAELIVMGSHQRGMVERLIRGSVAEKVAKEATVPVMVVRSGQASGAAGAITRLVLPLDGSPLAEESLPVATAIARRLGTPLFLVRAVNIAELLPPAVGMGEAIPFEAYDETEREMHEAATTYLSAMATRLRAQGLTVTTAILTGPPASAISEATQPGDVVILASNERSGVARWLMGSVAEQLVRDDDCPVILVPATEPAAAPGEEV